MVKTNAWTIPDLAKYLASVRSDLSADEMTKLKAKLVSDLMLG